MDRIPESDWKKLRALKDNFLNVACERILEKAHGVISDRSKGSHAAYLALWQLLKTEDGEIALMFDEFKRSTAILKLVVWKRNSLISDAALAEFSEETQEAVRALTSIQR
jgi:hypothetical protein